MTPWNKGEIEVAVGDYLTRGERATDYHSWSQLFTDDAVYVEHSMGVFVGRRAIERWIVACMGEYAAVTNWTEWYQIEGSRVVIYAWNNFPAPTPTDGCFQFPSISVLRYAGDGMFVRQDDFYDAVLSEEVASRWSAAGGGHHLARDHSIHGVDGYQPSVPTITARPEEIDRAVADLFDRCAEAAASEDWSRWSSSFTDDASYRVEHGRALEGRPAIEAWVATSPRHASTWTTTPLWHMSDGNRVIVRLSCAPESPASGAGYDVMTVLHYAGGGSWSYREDVFNPHERRW